MNDIYRTDRDIDELLGHENNVFKSDYANIKKLGLGNHGNHDNGNGKKNGNQIRDSQQQVDVAVLDEIIGGKATSKLLDIGETQDSQHRNGKNSNNDVSIELVKEKEKRLELLGEKAIDKVDLFLNMIKQEKVEEMKVKDIASSAEKMVNIHDKIRRRNENRLNENMRAQINFFGPTQVKVDEYIVKEV